MNESDKDVYSRFLIELAPRLKKIGKTLSVDVTAPDAQKLGLCVLIEIQLQMLQII